MKSASRWLTIIRFSLFHWLYTQNGLNLFSRWQHSKKMLTKKEIIATSLFVSNIFYYLCTIRVITLKHNNEELRNTNGCYLVTQFSSNPTNRFILSKLSFLAKVTKKENKKQASWHKKIGASRKGSSERVKI